MTRALRVGVIGAGFGQHVQVPAFRSAPDVTVQAICASTEERARRFAERLAIPRWSGAWQSLVSDPELDIVAVSVPPSLQAEIVIAAARAGKHVFAEKPLASNAGEVQQMLQAVRATGVTAGIDFEFRDIPAWQRVKQLLDEGALGPLRQVYLAWHVETMANRENSLSWKRDAGRGGGTLNLFGSHALDTLRWLFGDVVRLAARLPTPPPATADARVEAMLELAGGLPASLTIAADAPFGTGHRLEVYGGDGALVLENTTGDYASGFTLSVGRRGGQRSAVDVPAFPGAGDGRIQATGSVVRRFVDAIRAGRPMSPGFEDGLHVQKLIDAIREADRRGTWLSPS